MVRVLGFSTSAKSTSLATWLRALLRSMLNIATSLFWPLACNEALTARINALLKNLLYAFLSWLRHAADPSPCSPLTGFFGRLLAAWSGRGCSGSTPPQMAHRQKKCFSTTLRTDSDLECFQKFSVTALPCSWLGHFPPSSLGVRLGQPSMPLPQHVVEAKSAAAEISDSRSVKSETSLSIARVHAPQV